MPDAPLGAIVEVPSDGSLSHRDVGLTLARRAASSLPCRSLPASSSRASGTTRTALLSLHEPVPGVAGRRDDDAGSDRHGNEEAGPPRQSESNVTVAQRPVRRDLHDRAERRIRHCAYPATAGESNADPACRACTCAFTHG